MHIERANEVLYRTATPLSSIAAGELYVPIFLLRRGEMGQMQPTPKAARMFFAVGVGT